MKSIKETLSDWTKPDLVEHLLEHYKELKQEFFLGRYEQSLLNCGKFSEVVMRILECIVRGNYTPFGKGVSWDALTKELEQLSKDEFSDSIRLLIPRITRVIYDFRNKRGVAHTGEINPNLIDATFVVSACDWVMAEFVRLSCTEEPDEAQKIINSIIERKVPIVEEFEGDLKVLNPSLSVANQILLILYKKYPDYVSTDDLKKWIKTKSSGHVATVLRQLDDDARVYRRENENKITGTGIKYVEANLPMEI